MKTTTVPVAVADQSPNGGRAPVAWSLPASLAEVIAATGGAELRAGLIGRGMAGSRTPGMHEAEGRRLGLRYRYGLLDFDRLGLEDRDLGNVVGALSDAGFAGLNVTHPFKESILTALDDNSSEAEAIGAVNTVVLRGGRRTGHNTDGYGFAESFRHGLPDASLESVVVVGAGGAGRAIAHALAGLGAGRLAIFDVDPARSAALSARLDSTGRRIVAVGREDLGREVRGAAGVVNASPTGMAKYPGTPVPAEWLRPPMWVADAVYLPVDTPLLRAAHAAGCRTLPGTGMAIFQAVAAFELITGVAPDAEAMARHFQSL